MFTATTKAGTHCAQTNRSKTPRSSLRTVMWPSAGKNSSSLSRQKSSSSTSMVVATCTRISWILNFAFYRSVWTHVPLLRPAQQSYFQPVSYSGHESWYWSIGIEVNRLWRDLLLFIYPPQSSAQDSSVSPHILWQSRSPHIVSSPVWRAEHAHEAAIARNLQQSTGHVSGSSPHAVLQPPSPHVASGPWVWRDKSELHDC